jgi:DeoR family ulaG and ulaABCDEF operon transcriptional repressor
MFMGAQGVGPLGVMEQDALIIQAEQKLINQADELVLLVDSTKFQRRSSLILCSLDRVSTLITDDAIPDQARAMIENAGIKLVVAATAGTEREEKSSSAA